MAASYNESLAASWELPPATFVILSCHQHCLHSTRLSFLPAHPPPSLPPTTVLLVPKKLSYPPCTCCRLPAPTFPTLPPPFLPAYLTYLQVPLPTIPHSHVTIGHVIQQHFLPTCCQFWTVGPGLVGGPWFQSKVSFSVHFLHHSMLARRFTLCVRLSQSVLREESHFVRL